MPAFKRDVRKSASEQLKKRLRALASNPIKKWNKTCDKLVKTSRAIERETRKVQLQKAIAFVRRMKGLSDQNYLNEPQEMFDYDS